MNGWNTNHQEYTTAKGDPLIIEQLISQFKLEKIVCFDQSDNLITTTIQHDQYIRLSDLLTLNVINKVTAFTLQQYLQVIIQLFELLQGMKEQKTPHGNLTMENILLDLTQSKLTLNKKPQEITFQIRLINFAQFYNQEQENDFDRAYAIYTTIISYFPNSKKGLDLCGLNEARNNQLFLETLRQLIQYSGQSLYKSQERYSWDPQFIPKFIQNYSESVEFPINLKKFQPMIQQLHQYYLIVNHYPKLNISNQSLFKKQFKYSSEPQNFIKTCQELNQIIQQNHQNLETITDKLKRIKMLMKEQTPIMTIEAYQNHMYQEYIRYLKIKGYFENICTFEKIVQDINKLSQFEGNSFLSSLIKYSYINFNNEILNPQFQSYLILLEIFQRKLKDFEINYKNPEFNVFLDYFIHLKSELNDQLYKIKIIGQRNSETLINFYTDVHFGREYRESNKINTDQLIQSVSESWIRWIDQYIIDKKIKQFEEIALINDNNFTEFIQKQGFQQLQVQLKNLLEQMQQSLLSRCNQSPLLSEQFLYIQTFVLINYQEIYFCVKDALCDYILAQFCQSIDLNKDIANQIKQFNENMQNIILEGIVTINKQYQTEIQIADNIYKDQWLKLQQQFTSEPFISFKHYKCKFYEYENQNRIKYLNSINFDPKQSQNQYQNHCLAVFDELFKGPTQGIQTLNMETQNEHAKTALNYSSKKYHVMLQRLRQQYQNDVESINWREVEKQYQARLYEQWKEGMNNHQVDEVLNLKVHEQQIQSITKDFIEMASQEGHNYLFDEEYQMINQNAKIKELEALKLSTISREFYLEILNSLKFEILIEGMKKILRDKLINLNLIPKGFTTIPRFYGQAVKLVFDEVRKTVWEDQGHCSFYQLLATCQSSKNLTLMFTKFFPQNQEQAQQLTSSVHMEYNLLVTSVRNEFKKYISSEEEYQNVIDEKDQLFYEIVHPFNSQDLDQDQIVYLEKQIDKYQKAKYLEWLNYRWNIYKNETQKEQKIDEEKWNESFQNLQRQILQTIYNKLNQIDLGKTLEVQFRRQWFCNCDPKIIVAFVDCFEE